MNARPIAQEPDTGTKAVDARALLLRGLPVVERRLELAGISTPVLEGGNGPPLLLLHGPGEFGARWMRVIPGLAKAHRVVAPDLPGHGESGRPRGELDEGRVLDWLDELIRRSCDDPPILVGHILGGAIAARFAADRTDRIRGLVLVDSLGLAPFRPAPAFAFSLIRFILRPTEGTYEKFMRHCEYDAAGLAARMGEAWDALRVYSLDRARDPGVRAAMRTLMARVGVPPIPPERLSRIDVPTTLVWGRHDRANRLRVAEAASTRFGWPLRVVEDAADDPPVEQPEAFLEALRGSIADIHSTDSRRSS